MKPDKRRWWYGTALSHQRDLPPSPAQVKYLHDLGYKGDAPQTMEQAGEMIIQLKRMAAKQVRKGGVTLHFDGSANPNPGSNCRCGFILDGVWDGKEIHEEKSVFIGQGTNNIAEYRALIYGLHAAIARGVKELRVYGDSQIVIRGVNHGPWKKGKPHLEELKREAIDLASRFTKISFHWTPRESNRDADVLTRGPASPERTCCVIAPLTAGAKAPPQEGSLFDIGHHADTPAMPAVG